MAARHCPYLVGSVFALFDCGFSGLIWDEFFMAKNNKKQSSANGFMAKAFEDLRKKLLDTSGSRSRLINLDLSRKSVVRIVDEVPDQLAEVLLSDKPMKVVSVPEPTTDQLVKHGYLDFNEETKRFEELKKLPDAREWADVMGIESSYELPVKAVAGHRRHADSNLQTLLFEPALHQAMKKLETDARTSVDETGNNILFLSLGFLEWKDQAEGGRKRLAPLYLIPVQIKKSITSGATSYALLYTGEDIIDNLTLREKLLQEFGVELPGIWKGEDQTQRLSPEELFSEIDVLLKKISKSNAQYRDWRIHRYGALATLSLGKLLMYLDLDPEMWKERGVDLLDHDIMRTFFSEKRDVAEGGQLSQDYILDSVPNIHEQFPMVDEADSSQMSVLIDALQGNHLVVEGPPGTGKSQTITNLLAAALSQGKSVLFVAEKQAALDVVKRRMDKAGLGEFCLDLHSDKAQKRLILDSFGSRILHGLGLRGPSKSFETEVQRYERAREELKQYADTVNSKWSNTGLTIHEILTAATRYAKVVSPLKYQDIKPDGIGGANFGEHDLEEYLELVSKFFGYMEKVRLQLSDPERWDSHPWYGVEDLDITVFDQDEISGLVSEWSLALSELDNLMTAMKYDIAPRDGQYTSLDDIELLSHQWSGVHSLTGFEQVIAFSRIERSDITDLKVLIKQCDDVSEGYRLASGVFSNEVIENLQGVSGLSGSLDALDKLGYDRNQSLSLAVSSLLELDKAINLSDHVCGIRSQVVPSLPEPCRQVVDSSVNGLSELALLCRMASELPIELIRARSQEYDAESTVQLFDCFTNELQSLHSDAEYLSSRFSLDSLPESGELGRLVDVFASTRFYSWLFPSWRRDRQKLKGFLRGESISYVALSEEIGKARQWKERVNAFNAKAEYGTGFPGVFQGFSINVDSLRQLVSWYGKVRAEYGYGFGRRVAIASVLFGSSSDVFRGLQSLENDGLSAKVSDLAARLDKLAAVFPSVPAFSDKSIVLQSDISPLYQASSEIRRSLKSIQSVLKEPGMQMPKVRDAIHQLEKLSVDAASLRESGINKRIFSGVLDLKISSSGVMPTGYVELKDTTAFMESLYSAVSDESLVSLFRKCVRADEVAAIISVGMELSEFISKAKLAESGLYQRTASSRDKWTAPCGLALKEIIARNERAVDQKEWLDGWIKYLHARRRMSKAGFSRIGEYLSAGDYTISYVQSVVRFAVMQALAQEIYSAMPILSQRSGHEQASLQDQFRLIDQKLMGLQRRRIAAVAARREVPPGSVGATASSFSEDALLLREIDKRKRHISIRNLVIRAGRAMQAYKPCFMMSPMAVAKYIPPGSVSFDLVVMDEASQVKPEFALSSLARGQHCIVVGDSKQLPPTSFFEKVVSDEEQLEDDAAIQESESILEAVSSVFKRRQLRWHYRSRHQSLIDFSNYNFYDSNLVVFPSPWDQSDEFGIKFTHIESGRFLSGVNQVESQRIVEAIKSHLLKNPDESLGVVAMNARQRDQIENDLELALKDTVFRSAFEKNARSDEPLFIKNLENVQGDERDVIFISFTYGPQEKGSQSIPQRFGPINTVTGWRRLNVLFTRAKKRVHAFTSMLAGQIVVGPDSSRGVRALKAYLAYAQTGNLVGQDSVQEKEPDSHFEIAVMDILQKHGYECVPQVGVAGYYIDIAVRDPGMPGRYLMGIECDGASYHRYKSTRDRDRVRQGVLEGLNWRIRRIWSTDWFANPDAEIKPILDELATLTTPIDQVKQGAPFADEKDHVMEAVVTQGVDRHTSLRQRLEHFGASVIQAEFPDTEPHRRLLRDDMIIRLVADRPTSIDDFSVYVPGYLRSNTCPKEAAKFLGDVLEIISDYEELH
jgi:very-short-patch-repair endonuclease